MRPSAQTTDYGSRACSRPDGARRSLPLALTVVLVSMLAAQRASAQVFTAPLVLEVQSSAPLPRPVWTHAHAQAQLDVAEHETRTRQRRARLMLAAGLGLLAGSAIHVATMASNRQCSSDPDAYTLKRSLYGAGVLGGIGFGLAVAGGVWLGKSARDHGPRPSAGQRWLAAGVGLAGAGLATLLLVPVWGIDTVNCSS